MLIREIQQKDNESIAKVIRDIFHELDAPKVGTAYADPILDTLYEVYQEPRSIYYVVEKDGNVVGGCGVAEHPVAAGDGQHAVGVVELVHVADAARGIAGVPGDGRRRRPMGATRWCPVGAVPRLVLRPGADRPAGRASRQPHARARPHGYL